MFSGHTERVQREVEDLIRVVTKHDQIRSLVWSTPHQPAERLGAIDIIRKEAPEVVPWKIYDHCGGYTRLYALFERFVFDVVEEWLNLLPGLYEAYAQLPERVRTCHRVGVGQILTKLGGDQYQHLSEEAVLKGIADGVVGKSRYSFLPDAFYTDGQNLWPGVLASLFKKVGIENTWGWINHHRAVACFLQDFRGNASSAESELKNLVHYRNLAAHGDIGEVVSVDEFEKVAKFIVALTASVGQLIMWSVINRRRAKGCVSVIGQVIHNFSGKVVGVCAGSSTVSVADRIIVMRDHACYYTIVKAIEEDHVAFPTLTTRSNQRIALELTQPAKTGSELLKVVDSAEPDFSAQYI